ncbi:YqeB family protein [Paenibacillus guangzhouensis]|uniref:YqeB family protein n=1 Tax=Paenibacillus guangzhouensis TaxID=1473112 RepID=UPI001267233C|nr:DUF308 domain-containing protein [Paenibacillus guangzhouensis]
MNMAYTSNAKTVVGYSTSTKVMLYGGFGLIGLAVGYFLPRIAEWALKLPWSPFEGPLKLLHSWQGVWLDAGLTLLGFIAGLVIAYLAIQESLVIACSDQEVTLRIDERECTIARGDVGRVFVDRGHLVILGSSGHELAREKSDSKEEQIGRAFTEHGYPYTPGGDPYEAEYRRWVPDTPDLDAAANAILKAREMALKEEEKIDVRDLRQELGKMGIIVRDVEKRQYWRFVK